MQFLTLHFKGPLMALQGPRIDGEPQSLPIPTPSLITGLVGAALDISRSEPERLQAIQDAMTLACVVHEAGIEITDYQIADLSKPHMTGPMWSSGTTVVEREGSQITGLRQQWRPYLADADMTVVIGLSPSAPIQVENVLAALQEPVRPLFLGRTSCPPEVPLAEEIIEAEDLAAAANLVAQKRSAKLIYLPTELVDPHWGDLPVSIPGRRDWMSNRHSGADLYVCRQPAALRGGEK
jgi:CRISPR system Cascade subunit CasD